MRRGFAWASLLKTWQAVRLGAQGAAAGLLLLCGCDQSEETAVWRGEALTAGQVGGWALRVAVRGGKRD